MAYGPGGTTLATSDGNGSIYLWDVATHKITATLTNPHEKSITAVLFGPGGTTLALAAWSPCQPEVGPSWAA